LPGPGTYQYDSSADGDDFDYYDPCGAEADGVDMVFSLTVGAGQILDVTQTPSAQNDAVLLLTTACPDPTATCLTYADDGYLGEAESFTYTNTTSAAQTLFIIADNFDPGATGPFTLDVKLHSPVCGDGVIEGPEVCDDMNAVAGDGCTACKVDAGYHCTGIPSVCAAQLPGDSCGNALTISASQTLAGTYTGFYDDYDPASGGCAGYSQPGADVVYAISLAAGQGFTATVTPDPTVMQDVALYVLTGCGDPKTMCPLGADVGNFGDPETVTYGSATARTVYLVVDGHLPAIAGPYSLQVNFYTTVCGDGAVVSPETCDDMNAVANDGCTGCQIDPGYHCAGAPSVCTAGPTGDLCSKPIMIPAATASYSGKFDGFADDYDPGDLGCTTGSEAGPDVAYSITLPAGKTLTAKVTPDPVAMQDVAVYLVTDCSNVLDSCLMGSDGGGGGMDETVSYTATATQTIFIIVDTFKSTAVGKYTLDVTVQ
jgi:cysteine-rich repeat protein